MKYVFVGDIHGKVEQVQRALHMDGHKVFVGDFMDSFDRSPEDHREALVLALDAAEAGEATLLYGNHELSYMEPNPHRCSGYKLAMEATILDNFKRIKDNFKPLFKPAEDWLVTHAGLHPDVNDMLQKPLMEMSEEDIQKEFYNRASPLHWIGHSRGGFNPVGGIFWCDFDREFIPVSGLNQIFGHTRQRQGMQKLVSKQDNAVNYCIDCLDFHHKFLELDL